MARFSDTIEASVLVEVAFLRDSVTPESGGNYGTSVTTLASGVRGDIQAFKPPRWVMQRNQGRFMDTERGSRTRITHTGFFDCPAALPIPGDTCLDVTHGVSYTIRAVSNWPGDHLELDLERVV